MPFGGSGTGDLEQDRATFARYQVAVAQPTKHVPESPTVQTDGEL
jgi:hypothetical protein